MTKNLFYVSLGLIALPRGDRENKSARENGRVKIFAIAGHHAVVCDAFINSGLVNPYHLDESIPSFTGFW